MGGVKNAIIVDMDPRVCRKVNGEPVIIRHPLSSKTETELLELQEAYAKQAHRMISACIYTGSRYDDAKLFRKAAKAMTYAANIEAWISQGLFKEE